MAPAVNRSSSLAARSIGTDLITNARIEVLLPTFGTIAVLLRIYLRKTANIALKWDDWTILFALLFAWGLWGCWMYTCQSIIGHGTVSQIPVASLEDFTKASLATEFLYVNGCNVIKFSVLFFYFRAFGTSKRPRITLYVLFALLSAYSITRILVTFLQCTPFSYTWGKVYPNTRGHCLNFRDLYISMASLNLASDMAILVFPMPIIWGLYLPLAKRITICIVFCMGALACVAGVFRLYFVIVIFSGSTTSILEDDAVPKLVMSALFELNIGMLTASLPAIRVPLLSAVESWKALWLSGRTSHASISDQSKEDSCTGATPKNDIKIETSVVDSCYSTP